MSNRIITLTTDFGLADAYVAAMKGVILTSNPRATIIDVSHDVAPQATVEAAFLTALAWPYFPPEAIHVVVVDPGVGSSRRRVLLIRDSGMFIGPDNGCLSAALPDEVRGARSPGQAYLAREVELPSEITAIAIENENVFRRPVSATFEGRDVFAPVAAFLSLGGDLTSLGPRIGSVKATPVFRAPRIARGIDGVVIHVDRFGNLITDIRGADLPDAPVFTVGGRTIKELSRTYADAHGLAAIVGSNGFVEIANPGASAAEQLDASIGASVAVS